jgi:hypothetical protein
MGCFLPENQGLDEQGKPMTLELPKAAVLKVFLCDFSAESVEVPSLTATPINTISVFLIPAENPARELDCLRWLIEEARKARKAKKERKDNQAA